MHTKYFYSDKIETSFLFTKVIWVGIDRVELIRVELIRVELIERELIRVGIDWGKN